MDEKRFETGKALLRAAHKFWKACDSEGQHGAVQWLIGTDGELIIFTRGEYRQRLMENIEKLSYQENIHLFHESMEIEEEEE